MVTDLGMGSYFKLATNVFHRIFLLAYQEKQNYLAVIIKLRIYKSELWMWKLIDYMVRESTVYIRPPSLLIPIASLVVLKTTLSFDNSLEGLTELTQSCYSRGYSLLQGKDKD